MSKRWYNYISPVAAIMLRRKGKSWKEIGIILAKQEDRKSPYQAQSVCTAVRKFKKEQK